MVKASDIDWSDRDDVGAYVLALRAENARYKAALERIANPKDDDDILYSQDIAQEALRDRDS